MPDTDYGTSRYQNATAERAHAVVLDGFAEESIYVGDSVMFDLVTTDDDGAVILRYDSQGFVDVEDSETFDHADRAGRYGRARVIANWRSLVEAYADDADDDA